jgi:AraC family transcriptional regulator
MSGGFHGKLLGRASAPHLRAVEAFFPGRSAIPEHRHERGYFSFLLAGRYRERIPRGDLRPCSGALALWHPRNEAHENEFPEGPVHIVSLEADSEWLEHMGESRLAFRDPRVLDDGIAYGLGLRIFRLLHTGTEGLEEIAIELIARMSPRPQNERPEWLRKVLDLMSRDAMEPLTLTGVAREAGVHPVHLSRTFHRLTGTTFRAHLSRLRVRRSCEELTSRGKRIADVAAECGFADQSHFDRVFGRFAGLSPSAYRRRAPG